jgi:hypothetical protein
VWDWTPTERREDNGQGDPEPHTMALRIVRDAVQRARESGEGPDRLTAKDVWERLGEEMTGQARKTPSIKTVRRWLDRWVASGVLVEGKKRIVPGSDKPVPSYTVPPSHARALSMYECPLLLAPRERLQEQEKGKDIASIPEEDVLSFLDESPVPKSKGQATDSGSDVLSFFPVPEGDLGEEGAKDIPTQISRARAYEPIFDADDDLWED